MVFFSHPQISETEPHKRPPPFPSTLPSRITGRSKPVLLLTEHAFQSKRNKAGHKINIITYLCGTMDKSNTFVILTTWEIIFKQYPNTLTFSDSCTVDETKKYILAKQTFLPSHIRSTLLSRFHQPAILTTYYCNKLII